MRQLIRTAVLFCCCLTLLTGIVYPLAVTGLAQASFPPPGQRQPDRQGRILRGRNWSASPSGAPVFLGTAFRNNARGLQRRLFRGFEPGSVEPGTEKSRPEADRSASVRRSGQSAGRFPWIWSPPREAGSIRISARQPHCTRSGVSRRPADSMSRVVQGLVRTIFGIGISAFSANPLCMS